MGAAKSVSLDSAAHCRSSQLRSGLDLRAHDCLSQPAQPLPNRRLANLATKCVAQKRSAEKLPRTRIFKRSQFEQGTSPTLKPSSQGHFRLLVKSDPRLAFQSRFPSQAKLAYILRNNLQQSRPHLLQRARLQNVLDKNENRPPRTGKQLRYLATRQSLHCFSMRLQLLGAHQRNVRAKKTVFVHPKLAA